jgi:predicted nucleic acid-binding protein
MKIYFDVCCLNRPFDDQSQDRIRLGFHTYDAYHLACAEKAKVDSFLTTDDRLRQLAWKHRKQLQIKVANPLTWLEEEKQK